MALFMAIHSTVNINVAFDTGIEIDLFLLFLSSFFYFIPSFGNIDCENIG